MLSDKFGSVLKTYIYWPAETGPTVCITGECDSLKVDHQAPNRKILCSIRTPGWVLVLTSHSIGLYQGGGGPPHMTLTSLHTNKQRNEPQNALTGGTVLYS